MTFFAATTLFLSQAAAAAPGDGATSGLPLSLTSGETLGLFAVMQQGGPLMWPILACSVVTAAIFAERFLYYRRCRIAVPEFLSGIANLLRRGLHREALERCEEGYGPVSRVVRQAILARELPPTELREVVREVALLQQPRLETHLGVLAGIGQIAPLLGLLGTVTGMIDAFIEIGRAGGSTSVGELASGVWTALITAAAGLAVAIPSYAAYNFLVSRMNTILGDMERAGIETIHVLTSVNIRGGGVPPEPAPLAAIAPVAASFTPQAPSYSASAPAPASFPPADTVPVPLPPNSGGVTPIQT
ncbi:biopolymer transport protein ExbB [Verrucomicrobium sp. GAS474]|uniref:MotA/TolQ/ExbB proton channel family protein n=1 Tax=Verrucomicrobium sp. GAS474 TaxID=1882831 RepID=UPI00087DEE6F|nr:MotA/TolQ/ExbB proton channel family protein [Verrucomicrobium sp. GAS474]SDU29786.1 biopolymer transport protein ExbB [Verrucomicrobium sp. GAS474]